MDLKTKWGVNNNGQYEFYHEYNYVWPEKLHINSCELCGNGYDFNGFPYKIIRNDFSSYHTFCARCYGYMRERYGDSCTWENYLAGIDVFRCEDVKEPEEKK